jgi:hypothetical protein
VCGVCVCVCGVCMYVCMCVEGFNRYFGIRKLGLIGVRGGLIVSPALIICATHLPGHKGVYLPIGVI